MKGETLLLFTLAHEGMWGSGGITCAFLALDGGEWWASPHNHFAVEGGCGTPELVWMFGEMKNFLPLRGYGQLCASVILWNSIECLALNSGFELRFLSCPCSSLDSVLTALLYLKIYYTLQNLLMMMHYCNNLVAGKLGFPTERVVCKSIMFFGTDN